MTVAELIRELNKLPHSALVMREGDEYRGDERKVSSVSYRKDAGFGITNNSVLLK